MATPLPCNTWLRTTSDAWAAFWRSDLARLIEPLDETAARRLFELYDERGRLWRTYLRKRFVEGSMGQAVVNPAAKVALALDAAIERTEKAFGVTPRARLQLGITLGEAKRSLEDLNEEANAQGDGKDPRGLGQPATP